MAYNEDILLLVILTMTYVEKVPVVVGSKIINRTMGMITKGELAKATMTWRQPTLVQLCLGHSSCPTNVQGDGSSAEMAPPSSAPNPTTSKEFHLDNIQGHVCTTWRVTIPPFGTINIHSKTDIQGHGMQVHVLTEPSWGPQLPIFVVLTATYGELHPGSFQVPICLRNLMCLPHCDPCQSLHWKSCSSQPGATGNPLNGNLGRVCPWLLEILDPGLI